MTFIIQDVDDPERNRTCDTRAEAEDIKSEMEGLGLDVEIIQEGTEPDVVDHTAPDPEPEPTPAPEPQAQEAIPESKDLTDDTERALSELGESIENDPLDVLPGYMITHVEGQPSLNKRGVSVLAYHYGVTVTDHEILTRPSECEYQTAEVRITVENDSGRTFTGTGEAHSDEIDKTKMLRMAETRAYKRAVIFATGTGIVGYQEVTNQL